MKNCDRGYHISANHGTQVFHSSLCRRYELYWTCSAFLRPAITIYLHGTTYQRYKQAIIATNLKDLVLKNPVRKGYPREIFPLVFDEPPASWTRVLSISGLI